MLISLLVLVIALVGLILYVCSTQNAKVAEIGRIMFFSGLLAFCLTYGGKMFRL